MNKEFLPKSFSLFREGITKKQVRKDTVSGVIVGIVALPLAIAFAIASGVSPEKGLITAVVAGFIISAFGGSRVQIGGPTGAFIVIVYGIVAEFGIDGLIISTLMAGVMLIGFGLVRLGNYLKFIPYPLIVGFTSGIALIIFTSQINEFFGWGIKDLPANFIDKWIIYAQSVDRVNWYAVAIAVFTIATTSYFYKLTGKVPGSVIAIIASSLAVYGLDLPVQTIGSTYGNIPSSISMPPFPVVTLDKLQHLIQPAFAIALLGAIESLLSAVVADGMIGGRHRPNIELIAQGGANILSSLFGGIPATGAIARTATNVKNGGRTPIAGMVHAVMLLLIMLFLAPFAKEIPLSCLAGILIVVAYNMSEWRQFRSILKSKSIDVVVLLTTFFLTVIFDLIIAIEVGIVLSSFLFMKRMSESLKVEAKAIEDEAADILFHNELQYDPKAVLIYEINGPLFFGAAQQFQDVISDIHSNQQFIIIRMRHVPFIDATGYFRLREIIRTFKSRGVTVLLSGVHTDLRNDFENNEIYSVIPKGYVFDDILAAIRFISEMTLESAVGATGKKD